MDFYPVYSETKNMLDFEKHFKPECRDYNDEQIMKTMMTNDEQYEKRLDNDEKMMKQL